jgi:hypothetical protein
VEVQQESISNEAVCSDPDDQIFVTLAALGKADVLVSGDRAVLQLTGQTSFALESPAQFKKRFFPESLERLILPPALNQRIAHSFPDCYIGGSYAR